MAETLCPGILWPDIRDIGKFLRHEYDRLEQDCIWFVVQRNLPPLQIASQAALKALIEKENQTH